MPSGDTEPVPELIDPFDGPDDDLDPDIYPDPTADDPPFGDEPGDDGGQYRQRTYGNAIRIYIRPPTDVGPGGWTDAQAEEMAEAFIQKLTDTTL